MKSPTLLLFSQDGPTPFSLFPEDTTSLSNFSHTAGDEGPEASLFSWFLCVLFSDQESCNLLKQKPEGGRKTGSHVAIRKTMFQGKNSLFEGPKAGATRAYQKSSQASSIPSAAVLHHLLVLPHTHGGLTTWVTVLLPTSIHPAPS